MQILSKIRSCLLFLFNFRKPQFCELDFVDLIIDDKPLFLLAWKISIARKLKIKRVPGAIYGPHGSAIIQLPKDMKKVELVIRSIWRKNRVTLDLKHTALDKNSAETLIRQFRPLSFLNVKEQNISTAPPLSGIKINTIKVKSFKIHSFKKLIISSEKFKYP